MLFLLESLIAELMTVAPAMLSLLGAHEIPRSRRKPFITVRQGRETILVER